VHGGTSEKQKTKTEERIRKSEEMDRAIAGESREAPELTLLWQA